MNHEHVLTLVKTIDGAYFDAIHVFAFDAIFDDDVSHYPLRARRDIRAISELNGLLALLAPPCKLSALLPFGCAALSFASRKRHATLNDAFKRWSR
jgi:hypothetical protein